MQGGGAMPAIFTDPMYAKSSKWRLSTSTVRTVRRFFVASSLPCFSFLSQTEIGGFPPVCQDGYGICYMFWRSGTAIVAAVSARRSCAETSAELFKEEICNALRHIRTTWEAPDAKI